ncbi:MAG: GNAT family protein [Alphaproteobacteria bacterium]|nr:GNAT family protein [Alphaproteobacteria bacterium]
MNQFYGSPDQVRLQRKLHERVDWTRNTPGACNPGRFLGTDDPDALGWDFIVETLREDGAFGFRMIPIDQCADIQANLGEHGFRIDFWDVFSADAQEIIPCCGPLIDAGLPEGLSLVTKDELADQAVIAAIQSCMDRNGIVPFSGDMLSGRMCPSSMIAIKDRDEAIVATAYGYFLHNQHSSHASNAWGGLVAVDAAQRGKRLGVLVNALMVSSCVKDLEASRVHELVSEANEPSRRMVQRCGLQPDPTVRSGIATRGKDRFTR